ncbi:MAG: extracellular solute-binding protein [Anaerolineae bacterium]|nr:extracellular solute-binding protein [Anaerolineae bacterium]
MRELSRKSTILKRVLMLTMAFSGLLLAAACAQSPTPEVVTKVETVIVEREAEPIIQVETVEVMVTVEVEKEVERIVEVTPTPLGRLYQGIEATVMTAVDSPLVELLERRAAEFQAQTGANITIDTATDLHQTLLTELEAEQSHVDGLVYPAQWLADFAAPGYLVDLTERVQTDETLAWNDIAPFYGDISSRYGGQVYGIPLDADVYLVYYRPDVLEEIGMGPPKTWDSYLEVAGAANELDINQDGTPDFGSCMAKGEQMSTFFYAMAGPYLQFEGTEQGAFLTLDDLEPRVDNPGFRRALELYKETLLYSPPEELSNGLAETRRLVLDGRCTLTIDTGVLAKLASDPEQSTVQDTLEAIVLPGASEFVDPATGQLTACDEDLENCPFAVEEINYAPFAADGGWIGSLNPDADEEVQQAVYDFFVYVSAPAQSSVDVAVKPSLNPYRISQYLNRQTLVDAGMSSHASANYLSAIEETLANPNMILNVRIPQHQRYHQESLSAVLNQYLSDDLTTDEAVAALLEQWQAITDEVGREEQRAAYRLSLGLNP